MQFKNLAILLIFASLHLGAQALSFQQRFDQANQLAKQHKYDQALILYRQLQNEGVISANLYIDIANAEVHLGHFAAALVNFELAKKISDESTEINTAILSIVSSQQLEYEIPRMNLITFTSRQLSPGNWLIIGSLVAVLFALLLILYINRPTVVRKKSLYISFALYIFFSAACCYLAYGSDQYTNDKNWAIVMQDKTALKNAPSESSSTNYEVNAGNKFFVKDKIGSWFLLQNQFGKKGWVSGKLLTLI